MTEELADILNAGNIDRFLSLRQDLLQARLVEFLGQQSELTLGEPYWDCASRMTYG